MEFLQEELDEILNIFSQESTEILQSMDKNLLLLEKKPKNLDVAMHLFRDAHSLKGSARMLGFEGIQNIAHKVEDVLGLIREEKLLATSNVTDAISAVLSHIDMLIKNTIDQKEEYISEDTAKYTAMLDEICKSPENPSWANMVKEEKPKKNNEEEQKKPKINFSKIDDMVVQMAILYSKALQERDYKNFALIRKNAESILQKTEKLENFEKLRECLKVVSEISKDLENDTDNNEEKLVNFNDKINSFIHQFKDFAKKEGYDTKNDYYDNSFQISYDADNDNEDNLENESEDYAKTEITEQDSRFKSVELLDLINKATETIVDINKNKHSLAELKSLLNEIVSRLQSDGLKKTFQTILTIILGFEKSNIKLELDSIEAIKEIFVGTAGIVETKFSKDTYSDSMDEIDMINQKASIIAQMVKYELENPNHRTKTQKSTKPVDWAQSFDTSSIKTLRVNSDKLDKLLNQIGNLIVARIKSHENVGMVKTIQDELMELQKHYHKIGYYMKFYEKKYIQENKTAIDETQAGKKDSLVSYNKQLMAFHNANAEKLGYILSDLGLLMKELQENNIKLNSTTSEIENMVKTMRVLPLSNVFNLFPRMVHNISKEKGKEIELVIEGGEVSADKKIIEDIKIPIMHVVRNSIAHGIEMPRERERIGKNKVGQITLQASQRENKIIISIKDDGRGINIEKIKTKAIEKGLVSPEAADTMSKEQLANFIFYPGFSTGDSVTELSGRGLGLDIVHSKISQLNGRVDVFSEENRGTVVTMELPTTMATMKAFILQEGGQLFAIPAGSIKTVLRITKEEIKKRDERYYFIYDGESIPICALSSILGIKREEDNKSGKYTLMVIKAESAAVGVIVQKLIGDEEILNKKLPEPMLRVHNISGITTLANGEMCLLLNVSDVLNSGRTSVDKLDTTRSLTLKDNSKYKILVVDDSVTTRRLVGNTLTSNGYNVHVETNVKDAIRIIETEKFDLIVSDYEMPEVSGYEFVQMLKQNEKTKNIPIFILTSAERPEGLKEMFIEAGADEFIKKDKFEQKLFINLVVKYVNYGKNQ